MRAAFTGVIANIAAIQAEYQANWENERCNQQPKRNTAFVTTTASAGTVLTLWIRTAIPGQATQWWKPSASGSYTVPAKLTTGLDDAAEARFVIGAECSGLLVHASAACSVDIVTTDI